MALGGAGSFLPIQQMPTSIVWSHDTCPPTFVREREFFIDNPLVRIHFITEMIWWTGLALWEFEFSFPGSLKSAHVNFRQDVNTFDQADRHTCSTCRRCPRPLVLKAHRLCITQL